MRENNHRIEYIDSRFASGMLPLKGPAHGELVELIIVQEMKKAGVNPAVIYAYEKTLLWITDNNRKDLLGRDIFSKKQLKTWSDAQVEFYKRNKTDSNE